MNYVKSLAKQLGPKGIRVNGGPQRARRREQFSRAPASDLAGQAHFIRVKKKGTGAMSGKQRNDVKILVGLTLCLAWRERHSSD